MSQQLMKKGYEFERVRRLFGGVFREEMERGNDIISKIKATIIKKIYMI